MPPGIISGNARILIVVVEGPTNSFRVEDIRPSLVPETCCLHLNLRRFLYPTTRCTCPPSLHSPYWQLPLLTSPSKGGRLSAHVRQSTPFFSSFLITFVRRTALPVSCISQAYPLALAGGCRPSNDFCLCNNMQW